MEIVRNINKDGRYGGTYKLININNVFYWRLIRPAEAPTLQLGIDRNTNKDLNFILGRLLFFKEEDLYENTAASSE